MSGAPNDVAARLESLVGISAECSKVASTEGYSIDGVVPPAVAKPASAEQAAEIIRFAGKENLAVIPSGARTKLALGSTPTRYDIALDISGLNQIAHYDPADLTVSVDAGMPIAQLNAALFEHNQFIPLLVPYYSVATIGGTIASGIDSPLRNAYGTARDFLLGAEFIDGTGALVKSGGRVVKNVSGYDLHKLLIGSLGTLGIITRLNFRTFPAPLAPRGFLASFPTYEAALATRQKIATSPLTPLTLDVLNPNAAKIFAERTPGTPELQIFAAERTSSTASPLPGPGNWFHPAEWQLCAGFAGSPSVRSRYAHDLTRFAEQSRATDISILDDATRPSIWGRLRESLSLFRESSSRATILRLSISPTHHPQAIGVLQSIAEAAAIPVALVARASGTLYIAAVPDLSANASEFAELLVREVVSLRRSLDGRASLLFVPAAIKAQLHSALNSQTHSDQILNRSLKSAFDPQNILAPGRF
jgi:FAD/FMN-containing dehydrogenase